MAKEKTYTLEIEVGLSEAILNTSTSITRQDIQKIMKNLRSNSLNPSTIEVRVGETEGIDNIPNRFPKAKIHSSNFNIENIRESYSFITNLYSYSVTSLNIRQNK